MMLMVYCRIKIPYTPGTIHDVVSILNDGKGVGPADGQVVYCFGKDHTVSKSNRVSIRERGTSNKPKFELIFDGNGEIAGKLAEYAGRYEM